MSDLAFEADNAKDVQESIQKDDVLDKINNNANDIDWLISKSPWPKISQALHIVSSIRKLEKNRWSDKNIAEEIIFFFRS